MSVDYFDTETFDSSPASMEQTESSGVRLGSASVTSMSALDVGGGRCRFALKAFCDDKKKQSNLI